MNEEQEWRLSKLLDQQIRPLEKLDWFYRTVCREEILEVKECKLVDSELCPYECDFSLTEMITRLR